MSGKADLQTKCDPAWTHPLASGFWVNQCLAWPEMRPFCQFGLAARAELLLGSLKREGGSREVGDLQGDGRGRVLSPRGAAGCCTTGAAQLRSLSPSRAHSCIALWGKPPLHRGRGRSLALLTPSPKLPLQKVGSRAPSATSPPHAPPQHPRGDRGVQLLSYEPGAPRGQELPRRGSGCPGSDAPLVPEPPPPLPAPAGSVPGAMLPSGSSPPQHPCDGDSKSARRSPTSALSIGSGPPHPAHWRCRRRPPLHKAPFDRASPVGSRGSGGTGAGRCGGRQGGRCGMRSRRRGGAGQPPWPVSKGVVCCSVKFSRGFPGGEGVAVNSGTVTGPERSWWRAERGCPRSVEGYAG